MKMVAKKSDKMQTQKKHILIKWVSLQKFRISQQPKTFSGNKLSFNFIYDYKNHLKKKNVEAFLLTHVKCLFCQNIIKVIQTYDSLFPLSFLTMRPIL